MGLGEVDGRYVVDGPCDGCQVVEDSTPTAVQDRSWGDAESFLFITIQKRPEIVCLSSQNPDA